MARKEKFSKRFIIHTILIIACILSLYPILRVVTISLRPGDRAFSDSLSVIPDEPTLEAYNTILFEKGYTGGKAAKKHSLLIQVKIEKMFDKVYKNIELEERLIEEIEKIKIKKDKEQENLNSLINEKGELSNENAENRELIKKISIEHDNYILSGHSINELNAKLENAKKIIEKEEAVNEILKDKNQKNQKRMEDIIGEISSQAELKVRENEIASIRKRSGRMGSKIKKNNDKIAYYKREVEKLKNVIDIKNNNNETSIEEKIKKLKNQKLSSNDIIVTNLREMKKIDKKFNEIKYSFNYYENEYTVLIFVKNTIDKFYNLEKKLSTLLQVKTYIETDEVIKDIDREIKATYELYQNEGLDSLIKEIQNIEETMNKGAIEIRAGSELEKITKLYTSKSIEEIDIDMKKLVDKQKDKGYKFFNASFWLWFANSMIVSFFTVFFGVIFALTAGYAFSRYDFYGKKFGLTFFLVTQMFPPVMLLLPMYLVMSRISISNLPWLVNFLNMISADPDAFEVYFKLITIYITTALPVCVWQMKGYYDTIPYSLEEAALIDGCTPFQAFYKIILPLVKPGIVVTALFSFMAAWTDFVVANVMVQSEKYKTLPLGLQSMNDRFKVEWANFSASSILVMIPAVLLFMYLSKFLVSGLTLGGVKE